ncbi:MAG: peptidyl-prolyl cis-trans isomerase [Lactobacillales bacterium]|jgi:foldase protein PrsA|nr:peptidyl-prolyl cis-trans isomerase [Lactobacillales bacterium]
MKKNKIILGAASALAIFTLAACGSGNKNIATMKGATISVEDFYNQAKTNQTNQQIVQSMIISKVFEEAYGDKVSTKEVDKKFDEAKKQYGDTFATQLKTYGYTTATFKDYIKQQLAVQAGLKAHVKVTDANLKEAWKTFNPEVTASIITASSEDDAKKVLEEVKAPDADFAKIAKEKSTDTATKSKGGEIKFDSTSTTVPDEVKTAAFKLKNGEISDVITVTDPSTYSTNYYIVKMDKAQTKGNSMDKYKDKLKKIAEETMLADQTFQTKTIGEELKKANVKIEDKAFDNVLSTFTGATTSSSSSTKSSK